MGDVTYLFLVFDILTEKTGLSNAIHFRDSVYFANVIQFIHFESDHDARYAHHDGSGDGSKAVDKDSPGAIRQAARLLLSLPAKSRPDGLYIMDDHLVTAACEGVAGSGVPMRHLTVVTHANFPNPQPAAVPVVDVGFDMEKLLEDALQKVSLAVSERRELGPGDWITARAEVRKRSGGS